MSETQSPQENREVRLSVNIDHVATLREARKAPYPSPIEAAQLAEDAGADGIAEGAVVVQVPLDGEAVAVGIDGAHRQRNGVAFGRKSDPDGIEDDAELAAWLQRALVFVRSLPPKPPKKR